MKWTLLLTPIRKLEPNQVFVFGSNSKGFHGVGAAGQAQRGDAKNTWRRDSDFLLAMASPEGSPLRQGKWSVYGVARGFQEGKEGKSYAIETVKEIGVVQSTTRREIYPQLIELVEFASKHPEWEFLTTPLGEGFAGYTQKEMDIVWNTLEERVGIPPNIKFIRMV